MGLAESHFDLLAGRKRQTLAICNVSVYEPRIGVGLHFSG